MSSAAVRDLQEVAAMQEAPGLISKIEARLEVCNAIRQAALDSPTCQVTASTVRPHIKSADLTHRIGATFAALRSKNIIVTVPGRAATSNNARSKNRQRLMPVYDVNLTALVEYIDDLEGGRYQ